MRPLRLLSLYRFLGSAFVALIAWGSLTPAPPQGPDIPMVDKWMHLAGYGLLMAWWGQLAVDRNLRAYLALGFMALGGALELGQGFMALGRTPELADFTTNALGVWLGHWVTRGKGGEILARFEEA